MRLPFDLERPLVFFDLETTGLKVAEDRIIELAIIRLSPQGDVLERVRRFNPGVPIPAGASEVHGIYDADVADEAPFASRAHALYEMLDPCDLAGFNIRRFDVPMLLAEFRRAGITFDAGNRKLIDVQLIFHHNERRDLSAAAKFYLEREHQEAHSALGDIRTTAAVLAAQLERYDDVPKDLAGLNDYCDSIRKFETEFDRWFGDSEGGLIFKRGKHRGETLAEVARDNSGYLMWMLGAKDMDNDVLSEVRKALGGKTVG